MAEGKTRGRLSDPAYRLSSPQLTREGEGVLLILTASQCGSDEFLCEATNKIGSQRSRPVLLPAGVTTGEGCFLCINMGC